MGRWQAEVPAACQDGLASASRVRSTTD
jgi:hypothetical protein